ncbi:hypothetical protein [Actinocatenispora sera]|uniref:Uncharacterized protein n=1 Tax=Actinocatenispora sera TaxID=390989 RepID=A0A810KVM9_9ACTN|nr:hypothetical protein [Actinocatenispora sera]BCJ26366.1 hypothetical protein Asera_04740 [Actinocatenispora sera]
MNDRDDLSQALHNLVDHEPAGEAPVPELLRRGRSAARARVAGRTATALGAVAVIGVGAAVAGTGGSPQHSTAKHPTGGQSSVDSPHVELASAVEKTKNTSFRVRSFNDGNPPGEKSYCIGDYDPNQSVGSSNSYEAGAKVQEFRVIRGTYYVWSSSGGASPAGWRKVDFKKYSADLRKGGFKGDPADTFYCGGRTATLQGVLKEMKEEGPIRDLGRKTWKGKQYEVYSVTSTKPVVGDGSYDTTQAWVGVGSGYVEKLESWQAPKGAKAAPTGLTFSHFGEPVHVVKPPLQ